MDNEKELHLDKRLDTFVNIQRKTVQAQKHQNSKLKDVTKWPLIRSWFFESIVNYYSLDMSYVFSTKLDIKSLEKALSHVLGYYPALAGRIHYRGFYEDQYVDLNNEGVDFIVCQQPDIGYEELVGSDVDQEFTMKRGRYCEILNGDTIVSGQAPLLTLKLTLLEKGGCVLGICISHSIVDGGAFSLFMKDLSRLYQDPNIEIESILKPNELYSRMSSTSEEISHSAKILKVNPSSILKSFLMRQMYSWAFYFLRKQKARHPEHCPPRYRLQFSKEELLYIKQKGTEKVQKVSQDNWISTNEALLVHFWTMLLDVCQLPDEKRKDLGISMIINPRARTKLCAERVLGSIGFGVNYAIDMSSTALPNKYAQVHEFCRWAVSDEVVSASITMLESGMSRNRFDPIYVNSRTSSELPYGLSRWNLNPQTLEKGNTFGQPIKNLAGSQSWNTGEVYKVVMRVDGGCDAYINMSQSPIMGNMISNWPLVRLIGPAEFFNKLSLHHDEWKKQIARSRSK